MKMKTTPIRLISLLAAFLSSLLPLALSNSAFGAEEQGVITLDGNLPDITQRNKNIQYDLDLSKERYFFFAPASYTGKVPYGLIVYTSPGDEMTQLPMGWKTVLQKRKLLFLSAQSAGNKQDDRRRCGLAVLGAMMARQKYNIDPKRIYAAGFSGGARVSGKLAFRQPEVFRGTIQACGADFYEKVPQRHHVPQEVTSLGQYGLFDATVEEIAMAKANARFVFVTGPKDFRYADIRNIYEGGFAKAGFTAKLIDVPGMDHDDCGPRQLTQALDFIELARSTSRPATVAKTPPPAWLSKPANKWPQVLLEPNIVFKDNSHLQGASGFLTRLPNGAIVAATAKHAVCDQATTDAFESSLKLFLMHPRTMPARRAKLLKLAIKPSDADKLDCVLMTVSPQRSNLEIRPARDTPAKIGETVYLVAVPYDDRSPQNVYKGTVRKLIGENEFAYDFEDKADPRGFSGAPVLDAKGNIVGIHLGSLKYNDGTVLRRALNMSAAAAVCTAPAVLRPKPKTVTRRSTKTPTSVRTAKPAKSM